MRIPLVRKENLLLSSLASSRKPAFTEKTFQKTPDMTSQEELAKAKVIAEAKAAKVVTRQDYSKLVTMKLAGRSDKKIADSFGATTTQIRPHITRAMAEYRQGKIRVDMKEVQDEAKSEVEERQKAAGFSQADANKAQQVLQYVSQGTTVAEAPPPSEPITVA